MKHFVIKGSKAEDGILYLTLEPKHSRDKLRFYAGQYATIGFKGQNGRRSPMRCFSIVSSPNENGELQFALRIMGEFTKTLSELSIGSNIYLQGPFGNFVVDDNLDKKIVFLAGGIGITPCISIIRTLTARHSSIPVTLLHSNRTASIPFKAELSSLKGLNPRLKVFHFVTRDPVPPAEANMLSGMIKEDHIKQVTSGRFAGSTYFLCGPKVFMDSMSELLLANGASHDRIISESFTQSSKVYIGSGHSVQKLTYAFASALLMVGIIGVSYLDLSRYVPKVVNAESKVRSSTVNPTTTTTSPSSNAATSTPSSSNTSSSSSSTNNSSSTTPTQQQTYTAPVTSVS